MPSVSLLPGWIKKKTSVKTGNSEPAPLQLVRFDFRFLNSGFNQLYDRFYMHRMREHINWLNFSELVSRFTQQYQIPRK